jgi:mannose-1-phosphate guanylyltransferase
MTTNGDDRFAIIMAGGDGTRLRPFVRSLRQKPLPKQYVNFIGRRSMLEHTIDRARKIIPLERIFAVVSQGHLDIPEAREQLAKLPSENIVVQPLNRGTWPGILLPLARIYADCDDPKVVTFPADHFIEDEEVFLAHVAFAMLKVEEQPARMVLLGITPDGPDPELGYIVPRTPSASANPGFLPIKEFIEKPSPQMAKKLLNKGALWNTLVLVTKAKTLLRYTRAMAPELYRAFVQMKKAVGPSGDPDALDRIYRSMAETNLSHGLLERLPRRHPWSLLTLPVNGIVWSDWGSRRRLLAALVKTGYRFRLYRHTEELALGKTWVRRLRHNNLKRKSGNKSLTLP